jgi:hypothetical protein
VHGGDVEDQAAAALGEKLFRGQLGAEERALQVDVEHPLVLVLGRVEDRGAGLDAGVVDHDVEPAEGVDRGLHQLLQIGRLADVGLHPDGVPADGLDPGDELRRLLGMDDVVDDDVGSFRGRCQHHRFADPAVAPGHDDGLAGQQHPVVLSVIRHPAGARHCARDRDRRTPRQRTHSRRAAARRTGAAPDPHNAGHGPDRGLRAAR